MKSQIITDMSSLKSRRISSLLFTEHTHKVNPMKWSE